MTSPVNSNNFICIERFYCVRLSPMKIKVRDVDMFYMVQGQGEPALVMHGGLGADHTCFLNTPFNKLSSRLKLYYYDHRCNGRSSCPSIETMTHENLAKDAEALRKALGLDNFTLIGHSYGGIAALEYALRFQSNLRRLLLTGSSEMIFITMGFFIWLMLSGFYHPLANS